MLGHYTTSPGAVRRANGILARCAPLKQPPGLANRAATVGYVALEMQGSLGAPIKTLRASFATPRVLPN